MARSTKVSIASSLRELMKDNSLNKITVLDVMEHTKMTRQSFYYHFQDIPNVLEWVINQQLFTGCGYSAGQSVNDWCESVISELERDREFYRKAFPSLVDRISQDSVVQFISPVVQEVLYGQTGNNAPAASPAEQERIGFFCRSLATELVYFVMSDKNESHENGIRRMQTVLSAITPVSAH